MIGFSMVRVGALAALTLAAGAAFSRPAFAQATPVPQTAEAGPAYFIADFQVFDREGIRPYSAQVEETFKPFSGRFVVRGGQSVSLEGEPVKGGIVVIVFDSLAQAQAWYASPAYAAIRPYRQASAATRAFIVEGTPAPEQRQDR